MESNTGDEFHEALTTTAENIDIIPGSALNP
jgi:hypothetical protein